jgi:hypothetical protein
MRNTDDFYTEILRAKGRPRPGYGGNVLPAMEIYADIEASQERRVYQDALEKMLRSDDENIRRFAVDVCLGFFVFRDALGHHEE